MTTRPDDCCRLHSPSVKGYQSNKFMNDRLTLSTKIVRRLSVYSLANNHKNDELKARPS